jgi:four helix bundle protein
MEENRTKSYNRKQKSGNPNFRKSVDSEVRKFEGELRPLMSEEEKADAQILELSYDFSCRIIRLYKYLNEGKLGKADRDIVDALGRQLLRSATSINANVNEAQHPQSDADFLSKASIALKEAREANNWIRLFADNGYLDPRMYESLSHDSERILKILITMTSKVKKRINGGKE